MVRRWTFLSCLKIAWYHVSNGKEKKKKERKGSSSGGARRRLFLFLYNLAVVDGSFRRKAGCVHALQGSQRICCRCSLKNCIICFLKYLNEHRIPIQTCFVSFWSREIFAETKCDDGQTIQRIKKIFLHNLF